MGKEKDDVDKKMLDVGALVSNTALNTKIGKIENKIPTAGGLEITTVLKTGIGKFENIIPDYSKYITSPEFNSWYLTKIKTSELSSE